MPVSSDQITRLYDTVFDRAPDTDGLAFWSRVADAGLGLDYMAERFIVAPEFATTYGQPTNLSFVQEMYRNILDREGEAEGVSFWTRVLDEGLADRADVVVGFSESPEHIAQLVNPAPVPSPADPDPDASTTPPPDTSTPQPGPPVPPVVLYGGDGADAFRGGGGSDTLVGWLGSDTLSGEAGDDFLWGGRDTTIDGDAWPGLPNDARDALYGGAGNDRLHGDGGDDRLNGDAGNDTLEGFWGSDFLSGGDGDDALWGDAIAVQSPRLLTNAADYLSGGAGNDQLNGGGGDDNLSGGEGDDVIDGWSGADVLTGGAGADRFLFGSGISGALYAASGRDTITDFGQGDVMDLSRVMPDQAFTLIGEEPFSGTERPEVRFSATVEGVLVQVDAPPAHSGSGPPPYGPPAGQPDLEFLVAGVPSLDAAAFIL